MLVQCQRRLHLQFTSLNHIKLKWNFLLFLARGTKFPAHLHRWSPSNCQLVTAENPLLGCAIFSVCILLETCYKKNNLFWPITLTTSTSPTFFVKSNTSCLASVAYLFTVPISGCKGEFPLPEDYSTCLHLHLLKWSNTYVLSPI